MVHEQTASPIYGCRAGGGRSDSLLLVRCPEEMLGQQPLVKPAGAAAATPVGYIPP